MSDHVLFNIDGRILTTFHLGRLEIELANTCGALARIGEMARSRGRLQALETACGSSDA
jgi:hypothetical protein